MEKIKPWQMAVIVIGLIGGIASIIWNSMSSGAPVVPNSFYMVDVQTGDLYEASMSTSYNIVLPARHPETKKIALIPIRRDGSSWKADDRSLSLLTMLDADVKNVAVDSETGALKTSPGQVKSYRLPRP